ncbi:MAG: bifunctional [glutamate--ammonia ligase]-adenylyl-L-tyrosine phosphorylase/[glutamate--ammonia-ligase] adenylyltransferase [Candidatus Dadabacteria bacterium]|nr:MAG: bifunctional [glutamate--ammonia ligase]-adenylyl-L-tyrosine phosphorylase/[glutamate--ammonia-ligase] adenylyltransferase [Candidatus Dadabacteria bacterium]
MNRVLPNPDNARNVLERYKEIHKRISSKKKDILNILSSYSCFLGRVILTDPIILDYLSQSKNTKNKKTPKQFLKETGSIRKSSTSGEIFGSQLRQYKYREFSRIIYRDIMGLSPFSDIMEELSDLASAIVESTYRFYSEELDTKTYGEFVVLGMGKLGGRELNLSSDIDLIYLYRDKGDPGPFFKLAERITKTLSAVTEDGFLYRVDLALRPGGSKSTVAVPIDGAVEHYYYWGDTWERAAMIKAGPIAGDLELGVEFVREIEQFVYKKFLDYNSIEELKDMKTKLDKLQKKRDVKLGKGGIREIEFFIQALQLVNGGKVKALRERNSLLALKKLRHLNVIDEKVFESLTSSYLFLRKVEHSIQLVDERQTHKIPGSAEDIEILAKRCGLKGKKEFEEFYRENTSSVSSIYKSLFFEPSQKTEEVGKEFWELADFLTVGNIEEVEAVKNLRKLGFKNPEIAIDLLSKLLDPELGALTQGGRLNARKVIPAFLRKILKSFDPDSALVNLERFISGIGWRSSIYAVLLENPDIIKLLARLFSTSGYLSNFLIRHPEYLDVITLRDVRAEFASKEDMLESLQASIGDAKDFEDKLDTIRRFRHVETLKICLRDLNGEVDPFYVGKYLSMVAEAILEVGLELAWDIVKHSKKGKNKRMQMLILGMGKLGGREMSYNSDLDVIFIYEGNDHEFYSKLGQKVISVLSVPTGEGFAYKMDMGLRPSGRSGALVTSFDSFKKYHEDSAQIWERQALIRAIPAAGNWELGVKVMKTVKHFVYEKSFPKDFYKEIHRLRSRMEKELAKETAHKVNIKTGRGGTVDIEFLVQMLQLKYGGEYENVRVQNTIDALFGLRYSGLMEDGEFKILKEGLFFLRKMENLLRLLHDRSINELYESDFQKLASELDMKNEGQKLREEYISRTNKIREIYDKYFL